jgi:F0F1-type ATP synthase membrane subunit b/b'
MITNAIKTPVFVAKPHSRIHERAAPKQEREYDEAQSDLVREVSEEKQAGNGGG